MSNSTPGNEFIEELVAIYEHRSDYLFCLNQSGQIERFHEEAETNSFGLPETLVGTAILDVLPLGSEDDLRKMISQALDGRIVTGECWVSHSRGKFFFEFRLFCFSGRKLLMMVSDVTTRKLAENDTSSEMNDYDLLQSQMHEALESITQGFALYDKEDRLVMCNAQYKNIYKESKDLLIPGTKFEDHIRESAYRGQVAEAVGREEEWVKERTEQHLNPKGTYWQQLGNGRWLQICERKTKDGEIVGVRTDVTEQKKAEEELKEREQHFRLFSLSTGDCFWNWDMITGTIERSSGFERVFGYQQDEILPGVDWWLDRIHPEDKMRVFDSFESAVAGGKLVCGYEYQFRCKNGSYAIIDDHVCLIRDSTGKVVRALGAMRDITKQRQTEDKLQQLQYTLAHANRVSALGELTSGIIHEITQPLYSISNFSAASLNRIKNMEFEGSTEVTGNLEQISKAAKSAKKIVSQIRGYLNHQDDKQRSVLFLNEVIEDALSLLAFEIRNRQITVDCDLAPTIKACVHPVQLQQVLTNLIINACESMDTIPIENRRILIQSSIVKDKIKITIEDNGTGVSVDVAKSLFDAFFTTKPDGLGIGMAVTRSIISKHDGKIWFLSPPHTGTIFHFTLPVYQEQ